MVSYVKMWSWLRSDACDVRHGAAVKYQIDKSVGIRNRFRLHTCVL